MESGRTFFSRLAALRRPLLLLLAVAPAALTVLSFVSSASQGAFVTLFLCALFFCALCLFIPGKIRVPAALVFSAALLFGGLILLPWRDRPALLVLPPILIIPLLASLRMCSWDSRQEVPGWCVIAGCGAYGIAWILHTMPLDFDPAGTALGSVKIFFVLFAFLSLYTMNRGALNAQAFTGRSVPVHVKRMNLLMCGGVAVLTGLIAAIPQIARAMEAAWKAFVYGVFWLMDVISNLLLGNSTGGGGGGGGGMDLSELGTSEPSALSRFLEKVVMVLALAAAAVLVLWFLRIVWKKLRRGLKKLLALVGQGIRDASEDYIDEVEELKADSGEHASRLRRARRGPLFGRAATPREAVRQGYGALYGRHREWNPGSTARENLPEDGAAIYEKARYSEHEVTQEDADAFRENIRGIR